MSSMSPDMYVGEHDKNLKAINKAQNVINEKTEDGSEAFLVQSIPNAIERLDKTISELDSRIADTRRDIK